MTTIRYDILTGTHYSSNAGTTLYRNGFPDGVLDTGSDTALKGPTVRNISQIFPWIVRPRASFCGMA